MKKKTIALGLLLATFPCLSSGQNVSYAYDEAGNRVKREIVLQTRAAEESTNESYSEMLNDRDIRIYPNPTEGQLTVEITGDGACRLFTIFPGSKCLPLIQDLAVWPWTSVPSQKGFISCASLRKMVAILLLGR